MAMKKVVGTNVNASNQSVSLKKKVLKLKLTAYCSTLITNLFSFSVSSSPKRLKSEGEGKSKRYS